MALPRWKQSQIYAGTDRLRSNAVTVKCGEGISANDIIVVSDADTAANGCLPVVKADANVLTKCRGPFFVADFDAAQDDVRPLALPWKVIKNVNTSAAAQVGDTVWLNTTPGEHVLGAFPAATADAAGFSLAVKIGRVLKVHASEGVIMLSPSMADGAPLIGRVLGNSSPAVTVTVTGFTTELNDAPVVVTASGTTNERSLIKATIAGGTLSLKFDGNVTNTDIITYMIHA